MSQKSFAVQDINHAALLLSRGYKMSHISREGPIVYWHFPYEVDLITREIQDFINGEARGNFKDFAEALRTLKQTIRQAY